MIIELSYNNEMFYLGQLFGFIAIIFIVISIQKNNKSKILTYQILSNICFGLQYICLNAYTAAISCIIGILRGALFKKFCTNKEKNPVWVLLFIIFLSLINGIFTFKDIFSIVAILSPIIYGYGLWQNNLKIFRIIALLNPVLWIIYNIHVNAYVGIICSIFEMISAIIAIYKYDIKKIKQNC